MAAPFRRRQVLLSTARQLRMARISTPAPQGIQPLPGVAQDHGVDVKWCRPSACWPSRPALNTPRSCGDTDCRDARPTQASDGFCQLPFFSQTAVGVPAAVEGDAGAPGLHAQQAVLGDGHERIAARIRSAAAMPTHGWCRCVLAGPMMTWLPGGPCPLRQPAASWVTMPFSRAPPCPAAVDGDDAGACTPGHHHAAGLRQRCQHRVGRSLRATNGGGAHGSSAARRPPSRSWDKARYQLTSLLQVLMVDGALGQFSVPGARWPGSCSAPAVAAASHTSSLMTTVVVGPWCRACGGGAFRWRRSGRR